MSTLNTCRVCLQTQAPFYNILDSPLHEIFEIITDMKVDLIDRSHVLCLLCHSHLKKTFKFVTRAQKSEEYLLSLLVNETELVKEIKFDTPHSLSMSKLDIFNYYAGYICKEEPEETETINQDQIEDEKITCTNIYDDLIDFDSQDIKEEVNFSVDKADTNLKSNAKVVAPSDKTDSEYEESLLIVRERKTQDVPYKDSRGGQNDTKIVTESKNKPKTNLKSHAKIIAPSDSTDSDDEESLLIIRERKTRNVVYEDSGEGQNDTKVVTESKKIKNSKKKAEDNLKTLVATSNTSEKNAFNCSLCSRTFKQKRYLTKHMQTHTGVKPHTCSYCKREFRTKQTLNRHLRIHTGEKPFTCNVCDRKFTDRITLIKHSRIHTGDKPYHCTFCKRKFSQIDALSKHVRLHTGEKPHNCTYCDSKFSRKDDLRYHLRTHTGEKPHHCTSCDKKFTQKQGLIRHLRTHTGEKPYTCSFCKFKCTQSQALTRHLRLHTGEKPFTCARCNKNFIDKACLIRHLSKHK